MCFVEAVIKSSQTATASSCVYPNFVQAICILCVELSMNPQEQKWAGLPEFVWSWGEASAAGTLSGLAPSVCMFCNHAASTRVCGGGGLVVHVLFFETDWHQVAYVYLMQNSTVSIVALRETTEQRKDSWDLFSCLSPINIYLGLRLFLFIPHMSPTGSCVLTDYSHFQGLTVTCKGDVSCLLKSTKWKYTI